MFELPMFSVKYEARLKYTYKFTNASVIGENVKQNIEAMVRF